MDSQQQRIAHLVAQQLCVEELTVTPEKRLVADLGADSLDLVELVMSVEDEFDLEMTDAQRAEKCVTVGDLFTLLPAKAQGGAA